jgi:adenine-specific DNA methylase
MSEQSGSSQGRQERTELPIERGFPIEQLNDIAEKEGYGGARQWYRPIYTMHKWWARRLGSVFRAISIYTLLDDPQDIEIFEPGQNTQLTDFQGSEVDLPKLIEQVSLDDPASLWDIYPKDVRVQDKKVLDPFMGGGTSIIEASRFGAECVGRDLNPVAWFVTKKQVDSGSTSVKFLEEAFETVKEQVAEQLRSYYKTPCPHHPEEHNADVMNYFWVKQLECVSCGDTVDLFDDYRVAKGRYENDDKYNCVCPECENVVLIDGWQSESTCGECGFEFIPKEGVAGYGSYTCRSCGQKYSITDAIQEQDGFDLKLYALEYYCSICDERHDMGRADVKGYRQILDADRQLFQKAKEEWESQEDLLEYIPSEEIERGAITASSSVSGNDVFEHGYTHWKDMFNERQLLTHSTLLRAIDEIEDQNPREFLLLAFSDSLRRNTMMINYSQVGNQVDHVFKQNSFNPPQRPCESNMWGVKYGTGTFKSTWDKVVRGVEWANAPTERYIEYPDTEEYPDIPTSTDLDSPETVETEQFSYPSGQNTSVSIGDIRDIDEENEYDAIITDPPYYDNIIYSEVSDFFYVWLKVLLNEEYEGFDQNKTPRAESIVTNPHLGKTSEDFESELYDSFEVLNTALKQDGVLTFTYHHSDSESWGELLQSLCATGFEVTATYPITADISKFIEGEAVSFDIVVVARPIEDTEATSWNSLRRDIYRTARRTRTQLEENRDLSRGDIGVMEMGACFREYSKHHGKVQRDGEIMSAKEVVQEIYGIIQEASDIGVEDVFIDLLDTSNVSYDDVNKLCRGTNASSDDLKEMRLYNQDDGFELGTWDNEKRQAYIQERVNGDGGDHLSNLDKLQFLRYRYEKGQAVQNYVDKWGVDDDLRELAGRLADVTGDDTYTRVLGDRDITSY